MCFVAITLRRLLPTYASHLNMSSESILFDIYFYWLTISSNAGGTHIVGKGQRKKRRRGGGRGGQWTDEAPIKRQKTGAKKCECEPVPALGKLKRVFFIRLRRAGHCDKFYV